MKSRVEIWRIIINIKDFEKVIWEFNIKEVFYICIFILKFKQNNFIIKGFIVFIIGIINYIVKVKIYSIWFNRFLKIICYFYCFWLFFKMCLVTFYYLR